MSRSAWKKKFTVPIFFRFPISDTGKWIIPIGKRRIPNLLAVVIFRKSDQQHFRFCYWMTGPAIIRRNSYLRIECKNFF